jgi:glycosyltransferase involved in cell wall biosynthesis
MPKVSVIIATRNRCALLPRAIESTLRAGSDVETVVVDDASEDQTRAVCANYVDQVRYVRLQRRLGIGGVRNVGLISSTAPYIAFLDDDDLRLPGTLDKQLKLLDAAPGAGLIYGKALYGNEQCEPAGDSYPDVCPRGDLFWQLLVWNFIPSPTVVFRRACVTRLGLIEEDAPGVEDWDLWVRIAEVYPVLALDEPVAIWRQPTRTSDQFTSRGEELHRLAQRLHREKWLKLPRAIEAGAARRREIARAFARRAAQQLLWEGAANLKSKQFRQFARVALASARLHPIGVGKIILSQPFSSKPHEDRLL